MTETLDVTVVAPGRFPVFLDVSRDHAVEDFRRVVAFSVAVPICPLSAVAHLSIDMLEEPSTYAPGPSALP